MGGIHQKGIKKSPSAMEGDFCYAISPASRATMGEFQ